MGDGRLAERFEGGYDQDALYTYVELSKNKLKIVFKKQKASPSRTVTDIKTPWYQHWEHAAT